MSYLTLSTYNVHLKLNGHKIVQGFILLHFEVHQKAFEEMFHFKITTSVLG
jgi:hypothetical protein